MRRFRYSGLFGSVLEDHQVRDGFRFCVLAVLAGLLGFINHGKPTVAFRHLPRCPTQEAKGKECGGGTVSDTMGSVEFERFPTH